MVAKGAIGYTPVKVSTENGALKPGDPITASSISGIGMKANPGDKIIGYTFESFNPNNGKMGTNNVDLPTPIQEKPFRPITKKIKAINGSELWQGWVLSYVNLGYAKGKTPKDAELEQLKQRVKALEAKDGR